MNLLESFNDLEARRVALLARLESVDEAGLNAKPQLDKWSIIQILCHLTLAEKLSLDYLRKKLTGSREFEMSGVGSAFKSWILKMLLRSRLKFKAPARSTDLPDQQDLEVTKSRWDKVRQELKEVIESFPDEMRDSMVFKHPVVGPMNICQMLSFFTEHFAHHARQIEYRLEG